MGTRALLIVFAVIFVAGCANGNIDNNVDIGAGGNAPTGNGNPSEGNDAELVYQPMQCVQTPWEKWQASGGYDATVTSEDELINAYIRDELGVDAEVMTVKHSEAVCQACETCPRDYFVSVTIDENNANELRKLGWKV